MAKNDDDAWLDDLLVEVVSSPSGYIEDDGFSSLVMQAVAKQEQARYEKLRRLVLLATAVVVALIAANMTSLALLGDGIQQVMSNFALVVLIPAAALAALMMSAGLTLFLKD